MTRIFLYEHITAHGIGRDPGSPRHSLFVEGRAMFRAIREDFEAIPGVEVLTAPPAEFAERAARADWSLVIAPETDGVLLGLAGEVIRVGGRLLGPSPEAIALTGDKFALFEHWRSRGVRTPDTVAFPAVPAGFPCVVKRRDGAGSEGMRLVESPADYRGFAGCIAQPFCPGRPASVAFLIGPGETVALPPAFQLISSDGQFRYGGGVLPIAPDLAARAVRLGRAALAGVPGLLGYVGVDLILGESADGSDDAALEINPRFTTSYVGLRAHSNGNIAGMLLGLARGIAVPFDAGVVGPVEFTASGEIRVPDRVSRGA